MIHKDFQSCKDYYFSKIISMKNLDREIDWKKIEKLRILEEAEKICLLKFPQKK